MKNDTGKSAVSNYLYNLTYQLMILILPLITTPYLSRTLGPENIGIYGYINSIVTYFILLGSIGIAMYAQREIAYVRDDKEKISQKFWEIIILRGITLIISIVVFYILCVMNGEYSIYYKILLLDIIAVAFDISAFFQGIEEFKKIVKRNLIVKIISIICIFVFVKRQTDLDKYILIYAMSNLIGNISLWIYLPRYIKKISIKDLKILRHLKPAIILFIPQIAIKIYTVLDKTMLGALVTNKAEVGYYEQAHKIIIVCLTIVTSWGTIMFPKMANRFSQGKRKEIKIGILKSFNFVYFLAMPMVFGLLAISKDLVPWFLGNDFNKSIYIIYLISPIILLISLSNVIGVQYLLPTKKQRQYTVSVIMGATTNLIMNLILIPKFYSLGAAVATVIAEAIVTLTQFYYVRKEFNIKEIISNATKYLIASFIMFTGIIALNNLLIFNADNLIKIITDIFVGAILYVIILIILKDSFFIQMLQKIFKIKSNKEET